MATQINRLTHRAVQAATKPGRYADGGGLQLNVSASKTRSWLFIYRSPTHRVQRGEKLMGRTREMGLGPADGRDAVSLTQARDRVVELKRVLAQGLDPLDHKAVGQAAKSRKFGEVTDEVIASLEAGWRNEKHKAQWRMTMEVYAAPLREKYVADVSTEDVLEVLTPIWRTKAETANRVRGRIEKVLDAAKAKGYRTGENPARWRGHLDHLLPKRQKLQRGHHPAMPWGEVPAFVARLQENESTGALALEFLILTAARSGEILRSIRNGEVMGARWDEFNLDAKVWTVPAGRMKAGREHRIPLSERAIEIVKTLGKAKRGPFVFSGQDVKQPLSDMALEALMRRMDAKPYTVHGFRSSFRDWAGETTSYPRELAEAALAHTVGDAVERAYRRGDALERRRELMEAWASYLSPTSQAKVVPISKGKKEAQ